jgi:hypothetical protein
MGGNMAELNITEVIKGLKKLKKRVPDDTICFVMGTSNGKPIAVPLYDILIATDQKGLPMITFHNERVYNIAKERR